MNTKIIQALSVCITLFMSIVAVNAVPSFKSATAARSWAEHQQRLGNLEAASQAYIQEANLYAKKGDLNAAAVEHRKANRLLTDVAIAIPVVSPEPTNTLAKYEPANGCYIGVRDDFEGQYYGQNQGNADDFEQRADHKVAIALDYDNYGRPFPIQWAKREARAGRAIQIAWEPHHIENVQDDAYLNQYARDAGRSACPIFLRFGGEMNGGWTSWGRSPAQYRRAFRTVHKVMERYAPNVIMVWAPNAIPTSNLDKYYPGDDVVDWVGISLYVTRYYDDRLSRPAWQDNPIWLIDPFYKKYASRKPLCLVECGVTRRSRVEGTNADTFAADRIEDLLNGIKIRYPRLKMACFFDRNNLTGAIPGRRLNDYALPSGSMALTAISSELKDPYFLGSVKDNIGSPISYNRVRGALPRDYSGEIAASISTYTLDPWLEIRCGANIQKIARPYRFHIPAGMEPVEINIHDGAGHIAKKVIINRN